MGEHGMRYLNCRGGGGGGGGVDKNLNLYFSCI